MDFSILIPVFNYDVSKLVGALLDQMRKISLNGEIILLDDASTQEETKSKNEELRRNPEVIYLTEHKNIGRAKARNKLCLESNSDHLIFLDADVDVIRPEFLDVYSKLFSKYDVVVGGHQYQTQKPSDKQFLLNWNYASLKESRETAKRMKTPFDRFISMNFYIRKEVLRSIRFPEYLKGWGHEDTYFGHLLKRKGIQIHHIDNPVLHMGLTNNRDYLKKQEMAIDQAIEIRSMDSDFSFELIKFSEKIRIFHPIIDFLHPVLLPTFKFFLSITHSPFILNMYKLLYFIHRSRQRT